MAKGKPTTAGSDTELSPKALADLINKKYGDGTVRMGSDPYFDIHRIPTGIYSLDWRLGGGFSRGRHIEIYGGYAVGKTFTTYSTIAQAQKMKLACAFVDAEHTFDANFAENAGVDVSKLHVHPQEYGQRCIDFMETLLRSGHYGVIVLDSVASLLPKTELEQDMDSGAGFGTAQAKMMSQALRRLTAANRSTVLIYINQLRDNIGVMFGNRDTTSGGRAMSFYASTRLGMTRTETIKRKVSVVDPKTGDKSIKDVVSGHRVLVRVDKDKTGVPAGSTVSFVFDYNQGKVDHIEDLIFLGRITGHVHKKGNKWWMNDYEDESQPSRQKFHRWLKKNMAVQEELRGLIDSGEHEEVDDDATEEE